MIWLMRPWFEARSLAALRVYLDQPLRKPLPKLEAQLLRGAVNSTMRDKGTSIDAALRFYAAYAETMVGRGRDLNEINYGGVSGRVLALQGSLKFFPEHLSALKSVAALHDKVRTR